MILPKDLDRNFNRVFVTGDIHGDMVDLEQRVESMGADKDDLVVLLGDCGFYFDSFYADEGRIAKTDYDKLVRASKLPCTILCVQGNHEQPFKEMCATKVKVLGGDGYVREGIYFAKNGTELLLNGKRVLVVGGASSVDKNYRLSNRWPWFEHEEMSPQEFAEVIERVKGRHFDFVFSHTVPFKDMPLEAFLKIDYAYTNGNATEWFLQTIKENITFGDWYAGHFHVEKSIENVHILYYDYRQII